MTLIYRSTGATSSGSTANTFAGLAIGTADVDRKLLICVVGLKTSGAALPTSVLVGSDPATMLGTGALLTNSTNHASDHSAWIIDYPTGTTADVTVNYAAAVAGVIVAVYELSGPDTYSLVEENSGAGAPISYDMPVLTGDFIFGLLARRQSNVRNGTIGHDTALTDDATYTTGADGGGFTAGVIADADNSISAGATGTRATCYGFVLRTDTEDTVTTQLTQSAILVVADGGSTTRVTQAAVLAITLTIEGVKITQAPVLAATIPNPLPAPLPLAPDAPLIETWQWYTTVTKAENGNEKRIARSNYPRILIDFSVTLKNDADRLAAQNLILRNIGEEFSYPLYQYATKPNLASSAGATRIYFSIDDTDVRAGEGIAFLNPSTDETHVYTIANMEVDGATITEPLSANLPVHWLICPAIKFRFRESAPGYGMNALQGDMRLQLESFNVRDTERPGQTASPTILDGSVLLDIRPLGVAPEDFDKNPRWLDEAIAPPVAQVRFRYAELITERRFRFDRPDDMDYWRAFGELIVGNKNIIYLPTYRDDFPLTETPALNSIEFTSSNFHFDEWHRSRAYKYVRIQSTNGEIYRQIIGVKLNYDSDGQAISVTIRLNNSIGSDPGDNENLLISLVNTCRLADDRLRFEHHFNYSIVSMRLRAVQS